ncbi:hypothetical protein HAX54_011444, partial [Datura stramonium]|nr:hypothetical protein [Datura stramonium]
MGLQTVSLSPTSTTTETNPHAMPEGVQVALFEMGRPQVGRHGGSDIAQAHESASVHQ